MNCIVTAGPTYEPLDDVRRLTNFSTGRLGTELANFLAARGHRVILLIGTMATHGGERRAQRVETFTTAADLREKLKAVSSKKVDAIFHAAAVGDFAFGRIFTTDKSGKLAEIKAVNKIPTGKAGCSSSWWRRPKSSPSCAAGFRERESWDGNFKRMACAPMPSAPPNGKLPNVQPICAS